MEILFGFLLVAIITILVIASNDKKAKRDIVAAGKEGERNTARFLDSLPNDYILIRNAVINYEGRKSEIDNIVIGKTGVFIIETKNQKGNIFGDCQEKDWIHRKVGRGGTTYSKEFYNPTKQVATHIYRLKGVLKQNGIKVFINGSVYFSNPEVSVKLKNPRDDIPVFEYRNRNSLLNYILDREEILTDAQIIKIAEIIYKNKM